MQKLIVFAIDDETKANNAEKTFSQYLSIMVNIELHDVSKQKVCE
jgi:hypothetical protein